MTLAGNSALGEDSHRAAGEYLLRHVVPCAVGFGISTPEQAESMCRQADGAIVGSAIVKLIAQYGRDSVQPVADYVRTMKTACRNAQ